MVKQGLGKNNRAGGAGAKQYYHAMAGGVGQTGVWGTRWFVKEVVSSVTNSET